MNTYSKNKKRKMETRERTKWGGFRPGAGRKPTGAEKITFCATPEAKRLIAEAGGNMSKFISDCIVTAAPMLKE